MNLVPTLQAPNWPHTKHAVHQRLLNAEDQTWMPFLTFADDGDTMRTILTQGDAETLRQQSYETIGNHPVNIDIDVLDLPEFDAYGGVTMAAVSGNEYAAEHILCKATMRDIAKRLNAKTLMVGIAKRGQLTAIDGDSHPTVLSMFAKSVALSFFEADSNPISPLAFVVFEGGILAGSSDHGIDAGKRVSNGPSVTTRVERESDVVRIYGTGDDITAVTDKMMSAFIGELERGGHVDVELHFETITEPMDGFVSHLRGAVEELSGRHRIGTVGDIRVIQGGQQQSKAVAEGLTREDQKAIGLMPFAIFVLVAAADGKLEESEVDSFRQALGGTRSRLLRTCVEASGLPLEGLIIGMADAGAKACIAVIGAGLKALKSVKPSESMTLRGDLVELAESVADATAKKGWLGLGAKRRGKSEAKTVEIIEQMLGMSL